MIQGLYQIDRREIGPAAELLADAFWGTPFFAYLFPEEDSRRGALKELFGILVAFAQEGGSAYATSPKLEGVLIAHGDSGASSGWSFARTALKLAFRMMRIFRKVPFFKTVRRLYRIKDSGAKMGAYYGAHSGYLSIELIAVSGEHRGRGHMSRLMRAAIEQVHRDQTYCLLETETVSNIAIYEHFGFRVDDTIAATEDMTYYLMIYDPYGKAKADS